MVPCAFAESNAVLSRPPDMNAEECDPLNVLITKHGDWPVVISEWKMTKDELAEVNKTGRVWLVIYGSNMPPAALCGEKPFGDGK